MESEESYIRSSEAKEKFPKPKLSGKETNRKQVIVILGCTGTGKSKLAIEIALHLREDFNIEIVNSDVLQVVIFLFSLKHYAMKRYLLLTYFLEIDV